MHKQEGSKQIMKLQDGNRTFVLDPAVHAGERHEQGVKYARLLMGKTAMDVVRHSPTEKWLLVDADGVPIDLSDNVGSTMVKRRGKDMRMSRQHALISTVAGGEPGASDKVVIEDISTNGTTVEYHPKYLDLDELT